MQQSCPVVCGRDRKRAVGFRPEKHLGVSATTCMWHTHTHTSFHICAHIILLCRQTEMAWSWGHSQQRKINGHEMRWWKRSTRKTVRGLLLTRKMALWWWEWCNLGKGQLENKGISSWMKQDVNHSRHAFCVKVCLCPSAPSRISVD